MSSAAWDAAFADMQRKKAASDAYDDYLSELCARMKASAPDENAIDWEALDVPHRAHMLHSADLDEYERNFVEYGHLWGGAGSKARGVAAIESIRTFREAKAANAAAHGWDEAFDRQEALTEEYSAAISKLIEMPAPDKAALMWKLNYLYADEVSAGHSSAAYCAAWIGVVMADADRFLGGEA
ncbi:hypothetical protein [Sphingobium boeckii]|uniref:Uncharacterized protein n=1 Tax=Sphingobium boeckii TaxID=1082345 RepID=A0A7W9AHN0_9SPHN|nr:hypothetical protein [Sphingobium boeckii]MBB5685644.1 hypothetical protein [Sphingobium boeckii]